MRTKILSIAAVSVFMFSSCVQKSETIPAASVPVTDGATNADGTSSAAAEAEKKTEPTPVTAGVQPRSIRDFFMLLPEEYFLLEGCVREKDKDCQKAKADYLKTFTEVEDKANGYLKGGCDGAQSCLEMAIFKRPDGSYLVGVSTSAEMNTDNYFLDLSNGKWTDVSASVVPQFSKKNIYELPRQGTTVKVFAKKIIEKGADYEVSEKGERLYDLEWKNGKFEMKK